MASRKTAPVTFTARQVARDLSATLGREISDKRVRQWVRDNVAAFDDDAYSTHAYDAKTRGVIVKGLTARYASDATGTAGRAASASNGRKGTTPAAAAPKPTRKPKPATVAAAAPATEPAA